MHTLPPPSTSTHLTIKRILQAWINGSITLQASLQLFPPAVKGEGREQMQLLEYLSRGFWNYLDQTRTIKFTGLQKHRKSDLSDDNKDKIWYRVQVYKTFSICAFIYIANKLSKVSAHPGSTYS